MRTRTRNRRRQSAAFTLMEVLLVLIILVVIGGIVAQNFMGIQQNALKKTATNQMQRFKDTLKMYQLDVGSLPNSLDALRERPGDISDPAKWGGPYLEEDIPNDPWNNPYQFKANGNAFEISSNGPDGQAGTEDDIVVKRE